MPAVSIILVSHNKPVFVREAIDCVLKQKFDDWEGILVDSGVLLNQGFFEFVKDPRMRVIPSGETREQAKTTNMASWCFNRLLNAGEVHGELILYLCDDDLLYPEAFATYWDYYSRHGREPQAMYASQDIGVVDHQGKTSIVGHRKADKPAGRFCRGKRLDCRVDYLQFCHTAAILEKFREAYGTTQYHTEDKRHAHHADGIFMERIGALTTVHPVEKTLSMNRRTLTSVNLEHSETALGRAFITVKQKLKGGWERLTHGRPY